jgi:hypothetical protein
VVLGSLVLLLLALPLLWCDCAFIYFFVYDSRRTFRLLECGAFMVVFMGVARLEMI